MICSPRSCCLRILDAIEGSKKSACGFLGFLLESLNQLGASNYFGENISISRGANPVFPDPTFHFIKIWICQIHLVFF